MKANEMDLCLKFCSVNNNTKILNRINESGFITLIMIAFALTYFIILTDDPPKS